jgi:hypothetical protein
MILQLPEDVLTLLYPILYHWGSSITKINLYKSDWVITVQHPEWGHAYGHLMGGVVTVFPQV